MSARTMTAFEFVASSRKRKESWSTVVLVAGVKIMVIAYDICKKGIHEVYVVIKDTELKKNVLHIPEMYIQKETQKMEDLFGKMIEDAI